MGTQRIDNLLMKSKQISEMNISAKSIGPRGGSIEQKDLDFEPISFNSGTSKFQEGENKKYLQVTTPMNPIKSRRETRIKSAIPKDSNSYEVSNVSSTFNKISQAKFHQKTDGRMNETKMMYQDSTNKSTTCADASSPTWPLFQKNKKQLKPNDSEEATKDATNSLGLGLKPAMQVVESSNKFNSFHQVQ